MKMPAIQFYPADWRKDPGVQALDYQDRGIWFEILCIMHESDERGVLLLNGRPMPEPALARLLGLDNQILTTTLTNLLTYGVASKRESDGALYSRRMVKDEALCQVRREAGKKGGNPSLVKQKTTTGDNQSPTPSSSTSSSTSFSSSTSEEKETTSSLRSEVDAANAARLEAEKVLAQIKAENEALKANAQASHTKGAARPTKAKAAPSITLEDSPYATAQAMIEALQGTDYEHADIAFYHEEMRNWALSKGEKKIDWLATMRGWILRASKSGPIKTTANSHATYVNGHHNNQQRGGGGGQSQPSGRLNVEEAVSLARSIAVGVDAAQRAEAAAGRHDGGQASYGNSRPSALSYPSS